MKHLLVKKDPRKLVVGVLSCGANEAKRELCRKWWFRELAGTAGVEAFFVIGSNTQRPRREGDVLYVPCPDDLTNVSQKSYWICRYALDNFKFPQLFHCDDDTLVHTPKLLTLGAPADYVGFPHKFILKGWENYTYAHGGAGYVMSNRTAKAVRWHYDHRHPLAALPGDLVVGGVLHRRNIPLTQDYRFSPHPMPFNVPGSITCHYIDTDEKAEIGMGFLNRT